MCKLIANITNFNITWLNTTNKKMQYHIINHQKKTKQIHEMISPILEKKRLFSLGLKHMYAVSNLYL